MERERLVRSKRKNGNASITHNTCNSSIQANPRIARRHEVSPLAAELLMSGSCWESDFKECDPCWVDHTPVDDCTPKAMWATQITPGCLFLNDDTKLEGGRVLDLGGAGE